MNLLLCKCILSIQAAMVKRLKKGNIKMMEQEMVGSDVPIQAVWPVAPLVVVPEAQASHALPETQGERKVSAAQAVHVVPSPV